MNRPPNNPLNVKVRIPRLGLGCMNISHAYGPPMPASQGIELIRTAFDMGYRHFDTATLYGFGSNEQLVGKALRPVRDDVFLASKCGMAGVDGKKVIDGRPETLKRQVDESLSRLGTEYIDLYYLHRLDKSVPIEESLGALLEARSEGKIRAIGLSEVSVATLERAVKTASIAAVQNEYSLWTRNCELGVSQFCADSGITLVAFSPLCRGFFGIDWSTFTEFKSGDIRAAMPRFQPKAISENAVLANALDELATKIGLTNSQLALAWVLSQGPHIAAIPGTTSLAHLAENMGGSRIIIDAVTQSALSDLFLPESVMGNRYPEITQDEIDTERFHFEVENVGTR